MPEKKKKGELCICFQIGIIYTLFIVTILASIIVTLKLYMELSFD